MVSAKIFDKIPRLTVAWLGSLSINPRSLHKKLNVLSFLSYERSIRQQI